MSKYIDAEKLKKIVEQAMQRALKGAEVDEDLYCDGRADAFEEVLLEIDSLQQEQSEEDFDDELDKYIDAVDARTSGRWAEDDIIEMAKHFYELGCRRTAEKYDEIEYNRQRAEEAELSEGLDAEMDKYFESMEVQEHENIFEDTFHNIARHFADWGRKRVLQEIYEGKVKPVDKITAAWLED